MTADKSTGPTPEIAFVPGGPRDAVLEEQLRQDKKLPHNLDAAIASRLRGDPPVAIEELKKTMRVL